ncbi:CMP-N-acetylneuraminate-beta-galactosamide-alpha-2,3-sialyltransferase 1-like [Mastacembelus armatus]|uniref:CMP-N-acetylneuraminate-beta-galactosamide-alpha-2,3-sialyltransferase 1 n=1 Tax=Mastacembelus armatus TaxID=205130 RepID=A0A3Q3KVU6_9TELE|nr:CMP-N-acetylneuraminate-beta-galactosamide-alpha-2,3-sialyltransferase 1-like [Mastacembelus armatus]
MITNRKLLTFLLCATGISVFFSTHDRRRFPKIFSLQQNTSVCACEKCLSEDELLEFNETVEPFLSANFRLSEDDFDWWKNLQDENRNFSTYRATVDMLFKIFPPSPKITEPSPDRCRSCAVVGNSGNLKGSHYGPLIDFQDVIIRMNAGQTKGYEVDVGNRTTHHIMYPESAIDLDNTTHLVLFPFKIMDFEWLIKALTTGFNGTSYMPVKSNITANKDLVMVINPGFIRHVHEMWLQNKGKYPSTGFMAVVLALHICDEVHVFGYGADNDGNWSHYWEKLKDKNLKTGIHPGHFEYEVIQQLAENHTLKFYSGW